MTKSIIPEVVAAASNRRSFVSKIGIASAAVGAAFVVDPKQVKAAAGPTSTDLAVLNFALNLEFLEAEFYTVATTGKTMEQSGINVGPTPGPTYGGAKVAFTNSSVFSLPVALEIAGDERAHVALLLGLLGSQAIIKPTINLNALGFGYANQSDFLKLARIFEDIGVTAYAGAAPLLSPAVLGYAAEILSAESQHVANIRLQIARLNIATSALDSVDIIPPPSGTNFFSLDANALAKTRTPQQVLYLAYGAGGVNKGGFFPDGANGAFTTSSTSPA